jgi:hypothetical protein
MPSVRKTFMARLPDWQSILLVFAVVSLVFYGWTIVSSAWKLNSWARNLNPWEIISLLSYLMMQNFLESVLALTGLTALTWILPADALRERFAVRGIIIALCVLSSMALHLHLYGDGARSTVVTSLGLWWFATFAVTAVLAWLLPKIPACEKLISEFADRATVFLYIFLPLTALAFIVIVFRFLFIA